MENVNIGDSFTLTYEKANNKDATALLTVRGKDHDLNSVQLMQLADALIDAAESLGHFSGR